MGTSAMDMKRVSVAGLVLMCYTLRQIPFLN